ncbi:MAG TPA: peptidoglycan DD-metalloendopeptidase family protein [Burkholderiales bacterium]
MTQPRSVAAMPGGNASASLADISELLDTIRATAPVMTLGQLKQAVWQSAAEEPSPTHIARALHFLPGHGIAIRTAAIGDLQGLLAGNDAGSHLRLPDPAPPYTTPGSGGLEARLVYVSGRVERSLYDAGKQAGLSDPLILALAEIFGWDIDFALDLHPGDTFGVVFEQRYWLGRKIADGPILAAEFLNQGRSHRAIAYRHRDGTLAYYTPAGRSVKRAFLRSPVKFSRVSSSFSESRYHPILKLPRAHTGVDYAAPPGTPVRATGDGRIAWLGDNESYGKTVVIDHGGTFSTLYAHLSRFRSGLKAGRRVQQGDIIGYVGSTGLATAPHLHYEFRVDGEHMDPLTFEFPEGEPLSNEDLEAFLPLAHAWVAQLEAVDAHQFAALDVH